MTATMHPTASTTLAAVLDGWKAAIDDGRPDRVARRFTADALFQGLHPEHSTGRQGISDYYASQPDGMTADYDLLDVRQPADSVIVGYAIAVFSFLDGRVRRVHLTVVLEQQDGEWLISHYHVSPIAD
jgi:uncharacterized protein (TIGR02246 family)